MGSCIICGQAVDGHVCSSHEEDVVFEFLGDRPGQLTPGRYYRGTVDGYADFGVFVDVGDSVTGLLHQSELDVRLDALEWEPGDAVYVQVTDVRDNGNVDLSWSIRQAENEFRGVLIDDPSGDRLPDDRESPAEAEASEESTEAPESTSDAEAGGTSSTTSGPRASEPGGGDGGGSAVAVAGTAESGELNRVETGGLEDHVGKPVRLEGEVIGIQQTSGPTVFELRDESGTAECAAFEEAGVRAYPDVDIDDVVRLDGEVERRRGQVQVETEALVVLEGDERDAVETRLEEAIEAEARPDEVALLTDHPTIEAVRDAIVDAAAALRRAVMEGRPVVVRHNATADGYAAGAAIERAVLPVVREEHADADAEYHFFERRPLPDGVYDMDVATDDVSDMLESRERHGEQLPLVVLVDVGNTERSRQGFGLLDVYGVDRIVIDASVPDETLVEDATTAVNPHLEGDGDDATATALAANVAALVNEDSRADVRHLPAVSYWERPPEEYVELAAAAGVDSDTVAALREAIALEAYYQHYEDKRELVSDILFDPDRELAEHVSEQFTEKLEAEIETVEHNLSIREARGVTFAVLDTDAFTHRFDFPPTALTLDEIHRRKREETDLPLVTIGVDEDELHLRSTARVDIRDLAETVRERASDAGVDVVGGRDGRLEFVLGERDTVLDATVATVAERLD
ncbi:MAG: RecJ-like exonuclease [Halobacteriales archaeon]|jgi:RecJ-like exonuclease